MEYKVKFDCEIKLESYSESEAIATASSVLLRELSAESIGQVFDIKVFKITWFDKLKVKLFRRFK